VRHIRGFDPRLQSVAAQKTRLQKRKVRGGGSQHENANEPLFEAAILESGALPPIDEFIRHF
jgi:hypothetical protein